MAPKKSPKGAKRKTEEEKQEVDVQQEAAAEEPPAQDKPDAEGDAGAAEGGDKEETAAAKKETAAAKDETAAGAPPSPKRQATEAKKVELDAAAPLGAGAKPENVLEEGRIFFIYRPKVNTDDPQSIDDLQRFFIILSPTSRKDAKHRLLAIGKKRLPSGKNERFFGFVNTVEDKAEDLMAGLGVEKYETKTRGTREKPAARVAGEGVYVIEGGKEGDRQTRLAYELELPQEPGAVQQELQIQKRANYVLSIKNPDISSPANAGLDDKADFVKDDKKMEQFGNYRWIGAHDTTLLDYPRCEFLLIGGGAELKSHVDDDTAEHLQKAEHEEVVKALHAAKKEDKEGDAEAEESALLAKLQAELRPQAAGVLTEPATEGDWK